MRVKQQVRRSPDATPVAGESVRVRRASDNATLTLTTTDADGFVTYNVGGSPGEIILALEGIAGGDKFWSSYDAMAAGAVSLPELPIGMRALGDGVVRGFASAFSTQMTGDTVLVNTGAALVGGYPVVYASVGQALQVTRPVSSTRTDRVVIRVYPNTSSTTPGKAEVALLSGVEGGSAPSLTQTDQVYEISLAQVTVPVALPITITDERAYVGETPMVSGVARASSASTSNGTGEALTGLTVNLTLPKAKPYTVSAELSAIQNVSIGWVNQGTFGSLGSGIAPNFNGPHQVAVDSSGFVYIADNANNRVVKLTSAGAYVSSFSAPGVVGVAVDASGNIYTGHGGGTNVVRKYSSAFVLQWTSTIVDSYRHVATDGTYVYAVSGTIARVFRFEASDGDLSTSWGSSGSGNGQFNKPEGIATDGTYVYVSEDNNTRVQKFTTAGVYVTKWGSAGTGNGQFGATNGAWGVAIDHDGNIWVADYDNNRVQQFTTTGTYLSQLAASVPIGIASDGTDSLWISSYTDHTVTKWSELPGGYGQLAIEIDGSVGTYTGIGQNTGSVTNMDVATMQGPDTISVRAFGKRTADTANFNGLVLRASAEVQR